MAEQPTSPEAPDGPKRAAPTIELTATDVTPEGEAPAPETKAPELPPEQPAVSEKVEAAPSPRRPHTFAVALVAGFVGAACPTGFDAGGCTAGEGGGCCWALVSISRNFFA